MPSASQSYFESCDLHSQAGKSHAHVTAQAAVTPAHIAESHACIVVVMNTIQLTIKSIKVEKAFMFKQNLPGRVRSEGEKRHFLPLGGACI